MANAKPVFRHPLDVAATTRTTTEDFLADDADDAGHAFDDDGLAGLVAAVTQAAADAEPLVGLDAAAAFGRFAGFVAEARGGEGAQAFETDVEPPVGEVGFGRLFGFEQVIAHHAAGDEEVEAGVRASEGVEGGVGGVGYNLEEELVGEGEKVGDGRWR